MEMKDTADPNVLTIYDCARWCEELADHIRANPDGLEWENKAVALQRRLSAAAKFAKLISTER